MNGRRENELKIEHRILNKLATMPDIMTDYYYSMSGKTAHTRECYINYVREFLNFIDCDYLDVTIININRFLENIRFRTDKNGKKIENGESIRRTKIFAVSNFYDFLVSAGLVETNPCKNVELPTLTQEVKVVSMDGNEIAELKKNIRTGRRSSKYKARDMAIISIGITTGLRVSAISEINIEDIDMEERSINVIEKGNVRRTVYFGDNTKQDIEDWLRMRSKMSPNTNALFISSRKNRLSSDSIYDMITKYTADFDKHITPHKMRSTCATNLYEKTHDIYMVQAVLGHKNIANTRRYANVSVQERRNAADILDAI